MSDEMEALLREIRDNQREAIGLQREHIGLYMKQLDRVERLNDRAEALQDRAGRAQKIALYVILPILLVAIMALLWPYARYAYWWMSGQ